MANKSLIENKSIRDTMMDVMTEFYEQVMFPHFDGRLVPIEESVRGLKEDMEDVQIKLDRNRDEHDSIFQKLDRNENDHRKIFTKLDIIEDKVDGHETRIKSVEKTLQAA